MVDRAKLSAAIEAYKRAFTPEHWADERYKWEAVKRFKSRWNLDEEDFSSMFMQATDMTGNLLETKYRFPRSAIQTLSKTDKEGTRALFRDLFDTSKDVIERIIRFHNEAEALYTSLGPNDRQHYQDANTITTYLWLQFPDTYFIYRHTDFKTVAKALGCDMPIKKGLNPETLECCYALYGEISTYLSGDSELQNILQANLTDTCYPDSKCITLTLDFVYYLSNSIQQRDKDADEGDWLPANYDPGITVDEWRRLLADDSVFTQSSLEIMCRFIDFGGEATCSILASRYGETPNFYNSGSSALAKRVAAATGCSPHVTQNGETQWWPILYTGRPAGKDSEGHFIWKLREELHGALIETDLSEIPLFGKKTYAIWKISHGPDHIPSAEVKKLEKCKVVAVHKDTRAKASRKKSQSEDFYTTMQNGDFFYLCYGNSIQLLGRITGGVDLNPEKQDGRYRRPYTVIARSRDTSPYKGEQKWWTPNSNSTCIKVSDEDKLLFEKLILGPYFGMTLDALLGEERGYWWLNANPKIWSFSQIGIGQEQFYSFENGNHNKRRIYQNFLNAKKGDYIIGYESTPVKQIVAIGVISRENDGENYGSKKLRAWSSRLIIQP